MKQVLRRWSTSSPPHGAYACRSGVINSSSCGIRECCAAASGVLLSSSGGLSPRLAASCLSPPCGSLIRSRSLLMSDDPFTMEYETTSFASSSSASPSGTKRAESHPASVEKLDTQMDAELANADSGGVVGVAAAAARQSARMQQLQKILEETEPGPSVTSAEAILREAKTPQEVRRVLHNVIFTSPLAGDVLNGHGFRVAMVTALTAIAPKAGAVTEWFEGLARFRSLGFELTRSFLSEAFNLIREGLVRQFNVEGRSPALISDNLNRLRLLFLWANEDRIVLDHVVFTRAIFILTMMVSFLDRQNIYRSNFSDEFLRRDGIVFEWVVGNERCEDYDMAVRLCMEFLEGELLPLMRRSLPGARAAFSLTYRLMDFYFAADQPEKMLSVLEDAEEAGIAVAESSAAKLMQLACAFNLPEAPELLLRLRAMPNQCLLASPDISRMLFYYGRAGGGKPCPVCKEPYNHRHVGLHVWERTTEAQRACPLFASARGKKCELEDNRDVPQCSDHSDIAFQLRAISERRSIQWGSLEWRGFLLCCMFSPRALEALRMVEANLPENQFDEFLRQTYVRLIRHHKPELLVDVMHRFLEGKPVQKVSPIVLQEALICAAAVDDSSLRLDLVRRVWKLIVARDSYVMPYTSRTIRRVAEQRRILPPASSSSSLSSSTPLTEEQKLMREIVEFKPRSMNLLDVKDGVMDFTVGSSKKNVYVASLRERASRDARSLERSSEKQSRARAAA